MTTLGTDSEGMPLWEAVANNDDYIPIYEDIHGNILDLEYLGFLASKGLFYYGPSGEPHDPTDELLIEFDTFMREIYGDADDLSSGGVDDDDDLASDD